MSALPPLFAATLLLASVAGVRAAATGPVELRCQAYLCKYGYLSALNCSCAPEVYNKSCLASHGDATEDKDSCPPKCSERQYKLALGTFQRTYAPPASWLCDAPTLAAMAVARCGESDNFPPLDDGSAAAVSVQLTTAPSGAPAPSQMQTLPIITQPDNPVVPLREASGRIRSASATATSAATPATTRTATPPTTASTATTRTVTRTLPCVSTAKAAAKAKKKKVGHAKRDVAAAAAVGGQSADSPTHTKTTQLQGDTTSSTGASKLPSTSPSVGPVPVSPPLREAPGRPERRPGLFGGQPSFRFAGSPAAELPKSSKGGATTDTPPRGRFDDADVGGWVVRRRWGRSTSLTSQANATFPGRRLLRWRVLPGYYYPLLSVADQEAALEQALRKWAAVLPLCFIKDSQSALNAVDILVAFATGDHLADGRPFDGPGGDISHSYPGKYTHFDAAESWYVGPAGSATGFQLTAAALHEFGHVLGLTHSQSAKDVMFSLYSDKTALSPADREAASGLYGQCDGSLDAVVDVTYTQTEIDDDGNIVNVRLYSTVIFRGDKNWLYKNKNGAPLDGEPKPIWSTWSGIPNSVDAVVQYSGDADGGAVVDFLFIFKGSDYYIFDYVTGSVISSGKISNMFKAGPSGQPIPNNIESAYFDWRDQIMYFFKASKVYAYEYSHRTNNHSCCLYIRNISDVYPLASSQSQEATAVDASAYQRSIDAVYLQHATSTLYFFVGDLVWISIPASTSAAAAPANSATSGGAIANAPAVVIVPMPAIVPSSQLVSLPTATTGASSGIAKQSAAAGRETQVNTAAAFTVTAPSSSGVGVSTRLAAASAASPSAAASPTADSTGVLRSTSLTSIVTNSTVRTVAATITAIPLTSTQRVPVSSPSTPTTTIASTSSAITASVGGSGGGIGIGNNGNGNGGRGSAYVIRYNGFWNRIWRYICQIDC